MNVMNTRGSISVLMVITLPVLLICAALVTDLGRMIVACGRIQAAADFGALAAVQNIDLERLYEGIPVITEDEAVRDAIVWTKYNLKGAVPGIDLDRDIVIEAQVYNASNTAPLINGRTGRILTDPTVSVYIETPWNTRGTWCPVGTILRSLGDASVKRASSD